MIAKAPENGKRGSDTQGLLRYLFGKGKANEHTDPHLVAAWDPEWLEGGAFAQLVGHRGWLPRLARDIDAAMTGHEVHVADGHVYHVVLSVPRADGQLGDEVWQALIDEAIEHMGFGPDTGGVGGCRWVAVHHGLSVEGNDHVHLLINLVRGDGTIANTYRDWPRWRSWCLTVEERLDLIRTAPAGAGRKATSRAELERAARAGNRTDRQRLTQLVAEAAAMAGSELDFLAHLQRADVRYKPRLSEDKVIGYAVALSADEEDTEPLWFSGSTLRRDLSLPRLRARWEDHGLRWDAIAEQFWTGEHAVNTGDVHRTQAAWRELTRLLEAAQPAVEEHVAHDRDRWSHTVGEIVDLIVALARFDPEPDRLQRTADHLARAAQLERHQRRPQPRQRGVALPLLVAATRAAAACKDPAPIVLAAVVLLIWSIVKILQLAVDRRQPPPTASARQQIATAADQLADHPILRTAQRTGECGSPVLPEPGMELVSRAPFVTNRLHGLDRPSTTRTPPAQPGNGGRSR
ncbi:relaxase/mobilization nuclease domain-containing protein [Kibdelosporangium phytohabitans]|uniref:MobA/VirD2-like nuclease domain-containing protein n=1 Tax=Kibdelosporangium phytohabitans TaxID=860235 RepID=A0A0N9I8U1_9PSEU|nr:hypothetical protein [Kibdelosporangium phytohabitans]ALG12354.1 hypothetical protein AOZ06_40760 [Kibdelosporangium phytohabitans]MBE1463923.1 hypothetical protein [Kibdelosporangium phytohabitans]